MFGPSLEKDTHLIQRGKIRNTYAVFSRFGKRIDVYTTGEVYISCQYRMYIALRALGLHLFSRKENAMQGIDCFIKRKC